MSKSTLRYETEERVTTGAGYLSPVVSFLLGCDDAMSLLWTTPLRLLVGTRDLQRTGGIPVFVVCTET